MDPGLKYVFTAAIGLKSNDKANTKMCNKRIFYQTGFTSYLEQLDFKKKRSGIN